MTNETKAQMAARHDREMRQQLSVLSSAQLEHVRRLDQSNERADRAMAALSRADDLRAQQEAVLATTRARVFEIAAERDVLRGFIFREIPVRLADLPAPIATALGVYVPGEG